MKVKNFDNTNVARGVPPPRLSEVC